MYMENSEGNLSAFIYIIYVSIVFIYVFIYLLICLFIYCALMQIQYLLSSDYK